MYQNVKAADTVTLTKANYIDLLTRAKNSLTHLANKRKEEIDALLSNDETLVSMLKKEVLQKITREGARLLLEERFFKIYSRKPWWGLGLVTRKYDYNSLTDESLRYTNAEALECFLRTNKTSLDEYFDGWLKDEIEVRGSVVDVALHYFTHKTDYFDNHYQNMFYRLPKFHTTIESVKACNDGEFTIAMSLYNEYTSVINLTKGR